MIWIHFGSWNSSAGPVFTRKRYYWVPGTKNLLVTSWAYATGHPRRAYWTPFVRVRLRYGGFFHIGNFRRFFFIKSRPSKWNAFVRDITAKYEHTILFKHQCDTENKKEPPLCTYPSPLDRALGVNAVYIPPFPDPSKASTVSNSVRGGVRTKRYKVG
jgi:hypothetical protein